MSGPNLDVRRVHKGQLIPDPQLVIKGKSLPTGVEYQMGIAVDHLPAPLGYRIHQALDQRAVWKLVAQEYMAF